MSRTGANCLHDTLMYDANLLLVKAARHSTTPSSTYRVAWVDFLNIWLQQELIYLFSTLYSLLFEVEGSSGIARPLYQFRGYLYQFMLPVSIQSAQQER